MTTGITFLLDTNIISALMKDRSGTDTARVRQWGLRTPDCTLVTSVVVQYELLFGLARQGSPRLQAAYELQIQSLVVLPGGVMGESNEILYWVVRACLLDLECRF